MALVGLVQTGVQVTPACCAIAAEEACECVRRAALARRTAETGMNRESSRSHAILTLTLEAAARMPGSGALVTRRARLNLVDLAGAPVLARCGTLHVLSRVQHRPLGGFQWWSPAKRGLTLAGRALLGPSHCTVVPVRPCGALLHAGFAPPVQPGRAGRRWHAAHASSVWCSSPVCGVLIQKC